MASVTFKASGALTQNPDGSFALAMTAVKDGAPVPPDPPNPGPLPPPVDTKVITPSGGDDVGLIQSALDSLPSGHALMLSGMFQCGRTLWLDGYQKILMADPAKDSGIRITSNDLGGHYNSLICTKPSASFCRVVGLDVDAQHHQTQIVFVDAGSGILIDDCYLHDIDYNPSGAPYAAIHSQNAVNLVIRNNRIERTTGIDGGEGVRGIWCVGQTGIIIIGNKVKDTGHTCIIADGETAVIVRNQCGNSLTQGTGIKLLYRPSDRNPTHQQATGLLVAENRVENTVGAGLMCEDIDSAPGGVVIQGNTFVNCGRQGTSFGAFYTSNDARGIQFRDNKVENCRSLGAARNLHDSVFERSTIVGANNFNLEDNCHNITFNQSGVANVGSNCSGITVDGHVVA